METVFRGLAARPARLWSLGMKRAGIAPFLFSIQPVIQLFLINASELEFSEIARSMLVSLLFGGIVLGTLQLIMRDWLKSSLIASLFIIFFFLFGDAADWVSKSLKLGPARADLLVLILTAIYIILWGWLVRSRIKNITSTNLYLNLLAILFLVNSGIQAGKHLRENGISLKPSNRSVPVAVLPADVARPDIYYIILDGYGRQDVLQKYYEFDNSSFVDALEKRGFYVAAESSSNYIQTLLSLSSSLNMDYIQFLKADGGPVENRAGLIEILNYSDVRDVLAQNGYQTVSFRNEYKATIPGADIYYNDNSASLVQPVTAFESIVINHSMARVLLHIPTFKSLLIEAPYDSHRQYILSTFAKLKEIASLEGDYFVYAHIIAPHPPFVFDDNGQAVSHDEPFTLFDANYYIRDHSRKGYIAGYRRQVQYINTLALDAVDAVLSRSKTPPIIIIQGDHGPGAYLHWGSLEQTLPAERLGILNAYYFPGQDYESLYPSISPVNSFRVLLNQLFDGDYELLPDRHYYSYWSLPFDFIEVTDLSLR